MKLPKNVYDVLAFIGRIFLPALSVLYGKLGDIWGLPYTDKIPLTLVAIAFFTNTLLGIESMNYFKEIENVSREN